MTFNKNGIPLIITTVFLMLLSLSPYGCGKSDVGKLKEELKEEKRKREESSRKYKEALNQLAKEQKRTKHLERLLLTLGERLEEEGKSLPEELAQLRKEKTYDKKKKADVGPAPKKTVEKLIKLGDDLYSKGDYAAAIEVYTSATEIATEDVTLYLHLGRALIKSSQYDKAIPIYEQITKMQRKHGPKEELRQAYNNLGWLYTKNTRYNEAELAYLRAIKADPEYANAYYNLGLLYDLHLDDELGAIEAFENYIELNGERSNWARKRVEEIRER
ncbi:MAG: tetratricopeptide repeat protein [Candidatus Brocadiales bacterium]